MANEYNERLKAKLSFCLLHFLHPYFSINSFSYPEGSNCFLKDMKRNGENRKLLEDFLLIVLNRE